jgi:hypothetical protein
MILLNNGIVFGKQLLLKKERGLEHPEAKIHD